MKKITDTRISLVSGYPSKTFTNYTYLPTPVLAEPSISVYNLRSISLHRHNVLLYLERVSDIIRAEIVTTKVRESICVVLECQVSELKDNAYDHVFSYISH